MGSPWFLAPQSRARPKPWDAARPSRSASAARWPRTPTCPLPCEGPAACLVLLLLPLRPVQLFLTRHFLLCPRLCGKLFKFPFPPKRVTSNIEATSASCAVGVFDGSLWAERDRQPSVGDRGTAPVTWSGTPSTPWPRVNAHTCLCAHGRAHCVGSLRSAGRGPRHLLPSAVCVRVSGAPPEAVPGWGPSRTPDALIPGAAPVPRPSGGRASGARPGCGSLPGTRPPSLESEPPCPHS